MCNYFTARCCDLHMPLILSTRFVPFVWWRLYNTGRVDYIPNGPGRRQVWIRLARRTQNKRKECLITLLPFSSGGSFIIYLWRAWMAANLRLVWLEGPRTKRQNVCFIPFWLATYLWYGLKSGDGPGLSWRLA